MLIHQKFWVCLHLQHLQSVSKSLMSQTCTASTLLFRWDPSLLEYISHSVRVPRDVYPNGFLWSPVLPIKDEVDAVAGTYWIVYCSMYPAPSFNRSGTFYTMTFRVVGEGSCYLSFYSTDLVDGDGFPIAHHV